MPTRLNTKQINSLIATQFRFVAIIFMQGVDLKFGFIVMPNVFVCKCECCYLS